MRNKIRLVRVCCALVACNWSLAEASNSLYAPDYQSALTSRFVPETRLPGSFAVSNACAGMPIPYNGGTVLAGTVNMYLDWYGDWSPIDRAAKMSKLKIFAQNVGYTRYFNIVNSYAARTPNSFRSPVAVLAANSYDGGSQGIALSDQDAQTALFASIGAGVVDTNGIYVLMTAKNVTVTTSFGSSCVEFAGYHDFNVNDGYPLHYAIVNDCGDTSQLASVLSHEVTETITDPEPQPLYSAYQGDPNDYSCQEIGDRCVSGPYFFLSTGGLDLYVQSLWVNSGPGAIGCQQTYLSTDDRLRIARYFSAIGRPGDGIFANGFDS